MSSPINRDQLIEAFEALSKGEVEKDSFFALLDQWASSQGGEEVQTSQFSARATTPEDASQFTVELGVTKSNVSHIDQSKHEAFEMFSQLGLSLPQDMASLELSALPSIEPREVSRFDMDTDAALSIGEETSGSTLDDPSAFQFDAVSLEKTSGPVTKDNFSDHTNPERRKRLSPSARKSDVGEPNHRFEFIRSHAKGGLGVVSVARDTELNREVAFKEIKANYLENENLRTRFNIEALITGSLEHPGVVPVYGYGKNDDGSPWLAMRFIKGETLKEAISNWHEAYSSPDESSEARLAFRNLLSRFVDSCFAIAYANNRGVLHRDIKPSNIMLGKYGETLVVDWGLAKKVGRANPADSTCDEASIIVDSKDTASTMDGSALGTPPYMSPEQAAGNLDAMGPASDVFSLGATLYFLVAGRTAFDGTTVREVIENARICNYQPPIEHKSTIPKALNSICCHAMAARPVDRYASALELASDIENWLADEPVSAYQETMVERSFRWVRRHRTLATSVCVLALAVTALSIIGILLVNAERNRTLAAMDLVKLEKNRTEQALVQLEESQEKTVAALQAETTARRQTGDLLNTITDDFVGELLSRQVEFGDEDRVFFDRVLQQFAEFTKATGDSGEAVQIRADGHFRIANLRRRLDDFEPAEKSYLQAEQMYASLVTEDPQPQIRESLASVNANLAILYAAQGKHSEAIERENTSIDFFEKLLIEYPDSNQYQTELAKVRLNRGNAYTRLGKIKDAESDFKASIKAFERVDDLSDSPLVARQHSNALSSLASFYARQKNKLQSAADVYQQAVSVLSKSKDEGKPAHEMQLAFARQNYGNVLLRLKRNDNAIKQLRAAVDSYSVLANKYPSVASYSRDLGRSKLGLSRALNQTGREGGGTELEDANRIIEVLMNRFPERIDFKKDSALVAEQKARVARKGKNQIEASRHLQKAADLRAEISKLRPGNRLLSRQALGAKINLANQFRTSEQYEKAASSYEKLLELLLADEDAESSFLRLVRFGLGDSLMKQKKYEEALPYWTVLTENDSDPAWKTFELQRAICIIRGGDVVAGIAAADSVYEFEEPDGVTCYDVGCCYAIAAGFGDDERKKEKYATRAVELLEEAKVKNFFTSEMKTYAKTDPDLERIRRYSIFKEFMASLLNEQ